MGPRATKRWPRLGTPIWQRLSTAITRTAWLEASPIPRPLWSMASRSSRHSHTKTSRPQSRKRLPDADSRPVALVTGASRGIGRAIASELASTHRLIATYRGRQDMAESLAAETGAAIFPCDLASSRDRAALIEFVFSEAGHIDL